VPLESPIATNIGKKVSVWGNWIPWARKIETCPKIEDTVKDLEARIKTLEDRLSKLISI